MSRVVCVCVCDCALINAFFVESSQCCVVCGIEDRYPLHRCIGVSSGGPSGVPTAPVVSPGSQIPQQKSAQTRFPPGGGVGGPPKLSPLPAVFPFACRQSGVDRSPNPTTVAGASVSPSWKRARPPPAPDNHPTLPTPRHGQIFRRAPHRIPWGVGCGGGFGAPPRFSHPPTRGYDRSETPAGEAKRGPF